MANGTTHLLTWVDDATRQRFAAVAEAQGISKSALLKRLVDQMLAAGAPMESGLGAQADKPRHARLSVRLKADDQLLLRERAQGRGMPAATYVSALVRSHLRSLPPLPSFP